MMHLLAVFPDKLLESGATGQKNFQVTCDEARKALESFKPELDQVGTTKERKRKIIIQASKGVFETRGNPITNPDQIPKQLTRSLLSLGCKVANILSCERKPDEHVEQHMKRKWDVIAGLWMEFLVYAGRQCTGSQHAQQLRQGDENIILIDVVDRMEESFNVAVTNEFKESNLLFTEIKENNDGCIYLNSNYGQSNSILPEYSSNGDDIVRN
ncbi:unnamed protein product [Dovyalis caffra]|uniref:Uncharacterized protein n=1 Tax=Dovyalis caffra TaxID=77055 RepID=A0AAV1QUL2_9ROSI|nr:unnamed protein product [Dovyalis caffra]